MAMRIILKHSSAEDQRPTVAQAGQAGELLLNTNSAGTFLSCKDSSGSIHQVGGIKISPAAPGNPVKGTVWLDISLGLDRGLLKVYNGSQWITGGGTFDACTDGGLVQDPISGCWSVELSIDDLTDVDTSTNAPAVGEILIWDGTNWVPESLADVQLDWTDLPACAGGGLVYDATNKCWKVEQSIDDLTDVDTSTEAPKPNDILIWNGTNWVPEQLADVDLDWSDLPACADGGLVYDGNDNCWGVDWDLIPWNEFPGGENIEWDPIDELWNVMILRP